MKPILIPLALAAALASLPALAEEPPRPRIVVTGEGEATVAPDMALLSLAVTRFAATAREALTANNEAMGAVLDAMKKAGIADRDLQTAGLSINPRLVYPDQTNNLTEPKVVGYDVANTLSIRVRDLPKLGEIIDNSVTLGVNQGGGITFTNDDPAKALEDARTDAVRDAMARAATLAAAAGVKLGPVTEISEQSLAPPPMPFLAKAERADMAAAVPIAVGENAYRVQVSVTFALLP